MVGLMRRDDSIWCQLATGGGERMVLVAQARSDLECDGSEILSIRIST